MYIYACIYIYVYICIYLYVYANIHICVCVSVHANMYSAFKTQSTYRSVVNKACTFSNSYTYTDSFCGASRVCVCLNVSFHEHNNL